MKRLIGIFSLSIFTLLISLPFLGHTQDAAEGKKLFEAHCTSCHQVHQKMVGPALAGINDKKSEEWLIPWIQNSQKVIESGDEYAQKIFKEYNQTVMPPAPLNDDEVRSVLAYIKQETQAKQQASASEGGGGNTVSVINSITSDSTFQSLIFLTIVLLVIVVATTISIFNLVLKLNDKQPNINWNKVNASILVLFFILSVIGIGYEMSAHTQNLLPEAAAEHGRNIDQLFNITLIITGIVFIITQVLLFYFSVKYRYKEGKKGLFYPVNDKLEFFWTAIPALVLTVMIIMGFTTWRNINAAPKDDSQVIEVYAYQFDWRFRYPGPDGELGDTDFKLTDAANNPLGLDKEDPASHDDIIASELHLPADKQVKLVFRARDVIHSAWLPHFRVQMYCQPGMRTNFKFTPDITTAEMQEKVGDEDFGYELACNQVCGSAHYNMRSSVVVEEQETFDQWLNEQEPVKPSTADAQASAQTE